VAKTTVESAPENAKLEAKNYYFCLTCLKCCLQLIFLPLGSIALLVQSHLVFLILLNCYLLLFCTQVKANNLLTVSRKSVLNKTFYLQKALAGELIRTDLTFSCTKRSLENIFSITF